MADRALVTGGAGFIGLHLARALAERGWQVTVVDDLSRGHDRAPMPAGVTFLAHDLTDGPLDAVLGTQPFQQVYHLAGVVGVDRVSRDPDRVLRVNLLTALHVSDWCARHPPEAVLFSSTSEVADGAVVTGLAALPVGEDVPAVLPDLSLARASYAGSKIAGELLFRHHLPMATRVRIVRLFNVYGPRMGYDHVIPGMIRRAHDPGPFAVFGADQTRAFCHVADAVAACIGLMTLPVPGPLTVNVGNSREEVTMFDLATRILALTGSPPAAEPRPAPPGSPARRVPDTTRLHELTGFRPAVSLDEGLRDTVEAYRREPRAVTR